MNLLAAILAGDGDSLRLTYGVVVVDSPLSVRVGSAISGSPSSKLASYTPVVNDFVAVLVQGADRLVIGKVG